MEKTCSMWLNWDSRSELLRAFFSSTSWNHLPFISLDNDYLLIVCRNYWYQNCIVTWCCQRIDQNGLITWIQDTGPEDALLLSKGIYGLVSAAWWYHKKIIAILKDIGFKGDDGDPCWMWQNNKAGLCNIALDIDDNLAVGHPKAMYKLIQELDGHGSILKVKDDLHDYLSCEIIFSNDQKKAWWGHSHLIANFE